MSKEILADVRNAWQWFLLQSYKQILFTFDKTTKGSLVQEICESPRFEYNLNKFRCDISCTSGHCEDYWWRLVQEGSLKCHHGFVLCTLQFSVIHRILFEFEETWLHILLHWRVAPRSRLPGKAHLQWTETIVIIRLSCRCFTDRCKVCLRVTFRTYRGLNNLRSGIYVLRIMWRTGSV